MGGKSVLSESLWKTLGLAYTGRKMNEFRFRWLGGSIADCQGKGHAVKTEKARTHGRGDDRA